MTPQQEPNHNNAEFPMPVIDGDALAASLGRRLRERRKNRDLTLQQLADSSGLSQPFLSQLENGKSMPSLIALHQVAAALGTSAQELIQTQETGDVSLIRSGAAECYEAGQGATACFLVEGSNHQIEANLVTGKPGAESGCELAHDGEEMIYVIDGTITATLQGHITVELHAGDTYTYPARLPHGWRNTGTKTARFLFISSPPTF